MKKTALSLLLLACLASVFAQTGTQSSPAPAWRLSQETNTPDAYNFTRFTLMGQFSAPAHGASGQPALSIDCIPGTGASHPKGKYLASNLLVGSTLKIVYVEPREIHVTSYFPKVEVQYRADETAKMEKDDWTPGTDKVSASVPRHALREFLHGHTVVISAADEHGQPISIRFDVPDSTAVAESCDL